MLHSRDGQRDESDMNPGSGALGFRSWVLCLSRKDNRFALIETASSRAAFSHDGARRGVS